MSRMDGKKTHTHTFYGSNFDIARPQKQYEAKNKTTSCPKHVLVDVYATGSGRRVVDQRVNRRLCVQKILVLSVEPRGEVIADVLRCDLGDVLVRRNGAVVRLQEHHHFHPVMSGRSPPLYCTLTLIAMQGHQKRKEKKRKEKKRCCLKKNLNVVVVFHIQRIGCQPEKTTLHNVWVQNAPQNDVTKTKTCTQT